MAGIDYELMRSLCQTFVADRNYEWHKKHCEEAEAIENQQADKEAHLNREAAQRQYKRDLALAKKINQCANKIQQQALRDPTTARLQIDLKNMRNNARRMDYQLEDSKHALFEARKACKYAGHSLTEGLVDDSYCEKKLQTRATASTELQEQEKTFTSVPLKKSISINIPGRKSLAQAIRKVKSSPLKPIEHDAKDMKSLVIDEERPLQKRIEVLKPSAIDEQPSSQERTEVWETVESVSEETKPLKSPDRSLAAILAATGIQPKQG